MSAGRCELRRNRIMWHYERLWPPLLAAITVDRDGLVLVKRSRLGLVNERFGKRHESVRAEYH